MIQVWVTVTGICPRSHLRAWLDISALQSPPLGLTLAALNGKKGTSYAEMQREVAFHVFLHICVVLLMKKK